MLRRIELRTFEAGVTITIVDFLDRKILDATNIQEMGHELFALVDTENRRDILLNFANVDFLSAAGLNKFLILERKIKPHRGVLRLCNLRPEVYEVFAICYLNQHFDIKGTEGEALVNWPVPAAA